MPFTRRHQNLQREEHDHHHQQRPKVRRAVSSSPHSSQHRVSLRRSSYQHEFVGFEL
jgi:hypothetical protein